MNPGSRNPRSLLSRLFARDARPHDAPPNVVLIMSDEHNAGVAGFAGSSLARTPHLDSLANRGVVFDSAYCNSPLCSPSRLSLTAGRYASRVGAWGNACWLPSDDVPSIAGVLNQAGYESILCGKQHYDATRRYGFAELGSFRTNQYTKSGIVRRRDPDDLTPPAAVSKRFSNFRTGQDSPVLRHDREVTRRACDFLSKRRRADAPFLLFTGYLAPHFPLIVPDAYWEHFRDRVPMPDVPEGFIEKLPLNYRHLRLGFAMTDVPEATVRLGRELYHGLTEWFDEQVGQVLGALADSRVADDTVVVYASDHGENLGEHGLWWKNCAYDPATRIPLVVSWPQRFRAGRRAEACSLVDLVATLADLGGARIPENWDGNSMLGWLDSEDTRWKDRAISEYYGHNVASAFTMLRERHWKYVYHAAPSERHPAERELYDLSRDPGEMNNLAADPEQMSRIDAMHTSLVRELGEHPDDIDARCRAEVSVGYGRSGS
jgi:choline-sulfatase